VKAAVKIITWCLWFGFVLWLSTSGDGFFLWLVDFIKTKIIRAEIPATIDFAVTIIPWNCFISVLVCLPVWLMKRRRAETAHDLRATMVFIFWLLGWNLAGISFWLICFPENIGNYSDAPSLSMLEPFAINDGWTPFELWCTWWGFIIVSNVFSAMMAFGLQRPDNQTFAAL
jgi:hypothetical protein